MKIVKYVFLSILIVFVILALGYGIMAVRMISEFANLSKTRKEILESNDTLEKVLQYTKNTFEETYPQNFHVEMISREYPKSINQAWILPITDYNTVLYKLKISSDASIVSSEATAKYLVLNDEIQPISEDDLKRYGEIREAYEEKMAIKEELEKIVAEEMPGAIIEYPTSDTSIQIHISRSILENVEQAQKEMERLYALITNSSLSIKYQDASVWLDKNTSIDFAKEYLTDLAEVKKHLDEAYPKQYQIKIVKDLYSHILWSSGDWEEIHITIHQNALEHDEEVFQNLEKIYAPVTNDRIHVSVEFDDFVFQKGDLDKDKEFFDLIKVVKQDLAPYPLTVTYQKDSSSYVINGVVQQKLENVEDINVYKKPMAYLEKLFWEKSIRSSLQFEDTSVMSIDGWTVLERMYQSAKSNTK